MSAKKINFTQALSSFLKFDMEGFIFKASEESNKTQESTFLYEQDTVVSYRYCNQISKKIVKLNPSKERIISNILDLFNDTLDSIQVIKKWSKNE